MNIFKKFECTIKITNITSKRFYLHSVCEISVRLICLFLMQTIIQLILQLLLQRNALYIEIARLLLINLQDTDPLNLYLFCFIRHY